MITIFGRCVTLHSVSHKLIHLGATIINKIFLKTPLKIRQKILHKNIPQKNPDPAIFFPQITFFLAFLCRSIYISYVYPAFSAQFIYEFISKSTQKLSEISSRAIPTFDSVSSSMVSMCTPSSCMQQNKQIRIFTVNIYMHTKPMHWSNLHQCFVCMYIFQKCLLLLGGTHMWMPQNFQYKHMHMHYVTWLNFRCPKKFFEKCNSTSACRISTVKKSIQTFLTQKKIRQLAFLTNKIHRINFQCFSRFWKGKWHTAGGPVPMTTRAIFSAALVQNFP